MQNSKCKMQTLRSGLGFFEICADGGSGFEKLFDDGTSARSVCEV
jgi:hypothetical protein